MSEQALEGLPVASEKAAPMASAVERRGYWRANLRILGGLLTLWLVVSYGAGIVFHEALDQVHLPGTGFPLGFWFAQQGAIFVFVGIIVAYVRMMRRLDRAYGVDEE
ncbi:MAG: DUF4212 domain-containing protein [Polyangiales bacterium]